jgi:16S rRNA (cytidine1402-2'-O)-methyltransferase
MGTLYVIATPIGNLEDLTLRAARVLGELDALACEDTRITRRIFERHQLSSPRTIFAYHEHNEEMACRRIVGLLEEGLKVGICSDGGCPGISDPGYRAIQAALQGEHKVEVLPGASAVPTALLHSGLPTSSYTFKGFPRGSRVRASAFWRWTRTYRTPWCSMSHPFAWARCCVMRWRCWVTAMPRCASN